MPKFQRKVNGDRPILTKLQAKVLEMTRDGHSEHEIAATLNKSDLSIWGARRRLKERNLLGDGKIGVKGSIPVLIERDGYDVEAEAPTIPAERLTPDIKCLALALRDEIDDPNWDRLESPLMFVLADALDDAGGDSDGGAKAYKILRERAPSRRDADDVYPEPCGPWPQFPGYNPDLSHEERAAQYSAYHNSMHSLYECRRANYYYKTKRNNWVKKVKALIAQLLAAMAMAA